MFIDKYKPLYAPDTDTGVEIPDTAPPPAEPGSRNDGREERRSIRENLERGFDEARRAQDEPPKDRDKTGRFAPKGLKGNQEDRSASEAPDQGQEGAEEATGQTEQGTVETGQAPTAWSRDAREAWAQVPPAAQAAILKREQDTERGVNELKGKYSELDRALAPHLPAIQQHGKTPAQAVDQLFGWFQALATNPIQAMPALFKSFNYKPEVTAEIAKQLGIQPQAAPVPAAAPAQQTPEGEVLSPQVQSLIDSLTQKIQGMEQAVTGRFSTLEQNFQQQSFAKTQEVLNSWSRDKPHYEEVRVLMGQLLTPDPQTGIAPVQLKDGRIDLDTAYDMAVYAIPAVREKVRATEAAAAAKAAQDKVAKEQNLQAAQAAKSGRKAVSITGSAPGAEPPRDPKKRGKTVRESLEEAITEHSA